MNQDCIYIGNHCFTTLIAVSETEKAVGLMGQAWPPPIMCFPFKTASFRKFWMKNTPSPLDILFVYNNKIISIMKGEPYSTASIGPEAVSNLVIELPFGTAQELNINVGDEVKLCYSIPTFAKCLKLGN